MRCAESRHPDTTRIPDHALHSPHTKVRKLGTSESVSCATSEGGLVAMPDHGMPRTEGARHKQRAGDRRQEAGGREQMAGGLRLSSSFRASRDHMP